ncbi:MAG: Zn-dependent protease [Alteromonadaceae bacterium]|nr:MAG: Zn-dependent protease [Alteromonadaceae bacterium]
MLYLVFVLLMLSVIIGPQLWVTHVLKKYHRPLEGAPGTGSELARHLIERFDLTGVTVEEAGEGENFYDPADNRVCLSPDIYQGKSLTAIAVAAHEVGHAIQFNRKEKVSLLRERYMANAIALRKLGVGFLMAMPLVAMVVRVPHASLLVVLVGIVTMLVSALMYVAILPEEFDASFNKALPILKDGEYVPEVYLPAVKQILRACALTYVAGALIDVLRLWRWLRYLR